MRLKLSDILDLLEELAPNSLAEDWDNPGLQVGKKSQTIHKILIALDPTLQALKTATQIKAQLLLTHHPLIFKPLFHLDQEVFPANVIFEAIRTGTSIIAAHTNLDRSQGGINDMLAQLFGLQHATVLQKMTDLNDHGVGLGRIGLIPESKSLDEMVETVKEKLGLQTTKLVGRGDQPINRIAVVGGSGGGFVATAAEAGADLLITGDLGHHHALEAENLGLALIDGGHFHTEKAALSLFTDRFKKILKNRNWEATIEFFQTERCPITYR